MPIRATSRGRAQKREREMAPAGYYTRDQVRDRLELTERELRKLIAHNVLRTDRVNRAGWALYSEAQLQTLLHRRSDGSLLHFDADTTITRPPVPSLDAYSAADGVRVFELIVQRVPLPVIAMQTGLHPRVVDQIRYDYDQLAASMTFPKEILDQMNALKRLPGTFPLRSPTDVLEVLKLAAAERVCPTCEKHASASECTVCITERAAAEAADRKAREKDAEPEVKSNEAGRANGAAPPHKNRASQKGTSSATSSQ